MYCSADCRAKALYTRRRRMQKTKVVEILGGKCVRCGWAEHQSGLIPHHVDPSTKSFSIGSMGTVYAWDRILAEAKKCILLCANCHAVVHATKDSKFLI